MANDISFDDLIPAKDTTAPSKGADISFDDLIPKTSTTPSVEGKGGAAFGMYSKPGMTPNEEISRAAKNVGSSAKEALPGSIAGLGGFGFGMEVGTAIGAITSPVLTPAAIPVLGFAGGLLGAFGASASVTALQNKIHKTLFPEDWTARQKEKEAHPYEAFAGETLANLAGMSPKTMAGPVTQGMSKLGRFVSSDVGQRTVSAGIQTSIEAGSQYVREGELDPVKLGVSAVTGAVMPGFNVLGKKAFGVGASAGKDIASLFKKKPVITTPKTPPIDDGLKPPEGSTPEEKAAFIKKVKEDIAVRDTTVPLVETAIRNKETGEIERLGPKHSEKRKSETIDTHDQGFVDEKGNFLDRKEAWNRAKSTGQVPEGQSAEFPKEGLHSGDLRKAGDNRFELAKVPDSLEGIPVLKTDKIVRTDTGEKIGAKTRRGADGEPLRVDINVDLIYQQFDDKPWTKPKVEGVFPIAEDAFKTPQEWVDFVLQHEAEHVKNPKVEGQSKASYENQINKAALEELAKKKGAATPDAVSAEVEPVVDRTTTDPRDVKNEQEFNDIAADIYEKHGEVEAIKFYEGYKEYKKTWLEPISETEKLVGTNLRNKLANERVTNNNTSDLKALAGNEVDLNQLTYDIDKGTTLVGKAKEVADKFRALMDELGKRALENGVIKGWHENYVARNVVTEGAAPPTAVQEFIRDAFGYAGGDSAGGTKTTTKYGKERKLETRQDLVDHLEGINEWLAANGEDYRFKLKTDNLADIYHDYALSVEKAIENKNLVNNLKRVRNVEGESLIKEITPEDPLPYGWDTIDNSELAGYAVHPDLKPHLNFVFDAGPGDLMKAMGAISQFTKRFNVVGSFFHAKSLMEVLSSANIPIWTPLKEAVVLPLVEKGVKAVTGKDIQLSAISKAVEQFKSGGVGDNVDQWIKSTLVLESPEDVSKGILTAAGKFADTIIGKYGPKTRVLEKSLSTVEKYTLGLFDKYTWDYFHTGGKLMVADAYLDKARMQAAKEGKPFDEAASRKEISRFVNDSFGGLDWYDAAIQTQNEFAKRIALATYSPAGRRGLQVALFAPDWTISTLRAFTSALPKDLNPTKWQPVEGIKGLTTPTTKADYARLYQFKTALTYFTLLNSINLMTANRPIWENKDPTRVEFPDGTSMQAMKHAMEPYHWLMDPDKTFANKMGFIPKALVVGVGGLEYASPQAPKLVDRSATGRLKAVGEMVMPFQIQAAATAPEGEGAKRAVLGTMGFPIYGSTPEQRKMSRAERELATKQQAWEYRDKEIKAGREPMTPKHRKEQESLRKQQEKLDRKKNK